ncbi:3797_t:CDS:2, partial [Gigaspora rosea]
QAPMNNKTAESYKWVLQILVMNTDCLKKAIQTRLDIGTNAIQELEDFMNSFITKYASKKKLIQKRQQENKNDTTSNCSFSDKEDFVVVENPVVCSKRGAFKKKGLKGFHKLEGKNTNSKEHLEIPKSRKPI